MPKTSPGQFHAKLRQLVADHPTDSELKRSAEIIIRYLQHGKSGAPSKRDMIELLHLRYLFIFYERRGQKPKGIYKKLVGWDDGQCFAFFKNTRDKKTSNDYVRDLNNRAKKLIATDAIAKKLWKFFDRALLAREAAEVKQKATASLPRRKSSAARLPMTLEATRIALKKFAVKSPPSFLP